MRGLSLLLLLGIILIVNQPKVLSEEINDEDITDEDADTLENAEDEIPIEDLFAEDDTDTSGNEFALGEEELADDVQEFDGEEEADDLPPEELETEDEPELIIGDEIPEEDLQSKDLDEEQEFEELEAEETHEELEDDTTAEEDADSKSPVVETDTNDEDDTIVLLNEAGEENIIIIDDENTRAFLLEYAEDKVLTEMMHEAYAKVAEIEGRDVLRAKDIYLLLHLTLNPLEEDVHPEEHAIINRAEVELRTLQGLEDDEHVVHNGFITRGSPLKFIRRMASELHHTRKRRRLEEL